MTGKMKAPVLFVGHGSPMNAIEDNEFTRSWQKIADSIPRPTAILAVSAHWYTAGSRTSDAETPELIYDMYGFPDALYQVKYPVPGAPELARMTQTLLQRNVELDTDWGIDHGTWSVLCKMYPEANIPVYQLSVDHQANAEAHFQMGQQLRSLREQGVLIFGSGNVVHNLARLDWENRGGYPWAVAFDGYIKEKILAREYESVIHYKKAGSSAALAFSRPDHFYPLLYALGAAEESDTISVYNDACTLGSISMTSYLFS